MQPSSAQLTQLKPEFFIEQNARNGWLNTSLATIKGFNRFETGRITDDIHITRSQCTPEQIYQCCIEHPYATTLLLYGEAGISQFSFHTHNKGSVYIVRPGDLWLINLCDAPLVRITAPNQTCHMQVLKFRSARLSQALASSTSLTQAGTRAVRLARQSKMPRPFQFLVQNTLTSPVDLLLAEAYALELIAQNLSPLLEEQKSTATCLYTHNHQQQATASPLQPAPMATHNSKGHNQEQQKMQQIKERLTDDLTSPPSLHELATITGMSHARLNREFKRCFGQTTFSWLRQYRLEQACFALSYTNKEITDIAMQLGFSSASHFAASFKKSCGSTPLEYRSQHTR